MAGEGPSWSPGVSRLGLAASAAQDYCASFSAPPRARSPWLRLEAAAALTAPLLAGTPPSPLPARLATAVAVLPLKVSRPWSSSGDIPPV